MLFRSEVMDKLAPYLDRDDFKMVTYQPSKEGVLPDPITIDTSAPWFVEGTHGDPLAPTVCSRRLPSSSRAAGYVLVEAHVGQRRHRWRRSCGDARRSASPTVRAF